MSGIEDRPVRCYEQKNLAKGVWETIRDDTGEVIETRHLSSHETQLSFDDLTRNQTI